ncbi:protein kinase C and casein kinase substrate in neurons protein 1 isoform X2 [Salmo salar]|uniref:Protein kinase C and casein kinase substrate in neurons protein 1 isoform X2 n=1 Tax=Salmo salar TaxID=8030 RepID=A0ABM3DGI3_SALSA|nr:protein kinase C and casein kinase substrate in neurons protein 1-like isoform X2 [Salmo salar]
MSPKMSTLPREPPEDTRMQSFWMVCKKYEKVLEDLTSYTPHYMEEMEAIFDQSQEEKKKRISFLKQAFMSIHRHLDITNNESWHYALGQVAFSWHPPNPDSSVGLPDDEA